MSDSSGWPGKRRFQKGPRGLNFSGKKVIRPIGHRRPPSFSTSPSPKNSCPADERGSKVFSYLKPLFNMGGKSNKFDYTNRPNNGAKLGALMGRDLEKEADKLERTASKQVGKVRKTSASSDANVNHPLDIKAPNKQLGDEGACAMADGLLEALRKACVTSAVRLEDLNLSANGITTASLARIAPAIQLACYDLKTLDLSNNNIEIKTDEQAVQWEAFLRSFKNCRRLRRLDLSGNPLGPRALEIFARVHIQEPHFDAIPAGGMASVQSLPDSIPDNTRRLSYEPEWYETIPAYMVNGIIWERSRTPRTPQPRRGLRGIPYITLTNIGLTDAGALWLSYVLEDHHYPTQMIDELNATAPDSTIKTYQQDAGFSGLDWDEREPTLGKDGLYLLKKTETIRRHTLLDDVTISTTADDYDDADVELVSSPQSPARSSVDRRRGHAGDRRASIRSIRTAEGSSDHELSELESARKKVQRHIIAHDGVSSVEIWRTALRIAISSTVLRGIGPDPGAVRRHYVGRPIFNFTSDAEKRKQCSSSATPVAAANGGLKFGNENVRGPSSGLPRQGTYAATLAANTGAVPGEPEFAITDVTNTPQTPKMIFKPHRKGAFSTTSTDSLGDSTDLLAVSEKLSALVVRDNSPARFVRWQESYVSNKWGAGGLRDSAVPSQLPANVMDKIALSTVTKRETTLLSKEQKDSAFAWGQDRSNFQTMADWRKMADSAQVWTLLESIGCLEYPRRARPCEED